MKRHILMKKFFRLLFAAVAIAGLPSCATDEPAAPVSGDTDSFSISIPAEVTSRVFSDGSTAKNIYVAVYPVDNANANPYISNFVSALSNTDPIS